MSFAKQRIIWKENYLLRPIVIANLGVFCLSLAAICFLVPVAQHKSAAELCLGLFTLMSCVAALATGIILFVPERDAGTDLLLGRLPLDGSVVSRMKLRQGTFWFSLFVGSAAIIGIAFYTVRYGENLFDSERYIYYTMLLVVPIECFLWSVVCSIKSNNSITAVVVAAISAAVTQGLIAFLAINLTNARPIFGRSNDDGIYLGLHVVIVLILATIAWLTSRNWLRGNLEVEAASDLAMNDAAVSVDVANPSLRLTHPKMSLAWQTFRMQWIPFGIIAVIAIVIGVVSGTILLGTNAASFYGGNINGLLRILSSTNALMVLLGASVGFLCFANDQSNHRFLFFQQQADYPRKLWAARVSAIAMMMPIVFISAAFILYPLYINSGSNNFWRSDLDDGRYVRNALSVSNCIWAFLTVAAVAQLIGILARWSVLSFLITALVSLCLWQFFNYIVLLGEPLWLFVGTLSIVCFAMSWWYAPNWISQRKAKRRAIVCGTLALTTLFACGLVLVQHRANEVPVAKAELPFATLLEKYRDIQNRETANESTVKLKKATMVLSNLNDLPPEPLTTDYQKEYLQQNSDALDLIRAAVTSPDSVHFLTPTSQPERSGQAEVIAFGLRQDSLYSIATGDIDRSLKAIVTETQANWNVGTIHSALISRSIGRLVPWAEMNGQTTSSIRKGIEELDGIRDMIFNVENDRMALEMYYEIQRSATQGDWFGSLLESLSPKRHQISVNHPWELERSKRISSLEFIDTLPHWRQICRIANEIETSALNSRFTELKTDYHRRDQTTLFRFSSPYRSVPSILNKIRYVKVRLALEGYRIEHGTYPASLNDLVGKGSVAFFASLPRTVDSGQPFSYSAKGLDKDAFFTPQPPTYVDRYSRVKLNRRLDAEELIERDTPFLLPWSGLPVMIKEFRKVTGSVSQADRFELIVDDQDGYWLPQPFTYQQLTDMNYGNTEQWKLKRDK